MYPVVVTVALPKYKFFISFFRTHIYCRVNRAATLTQIRFNVPIIWPGERSSHIARTICDCVRDNALCSVRKKKRWTWQTRHDTNWLFIELNHGFVPLRLLSDFVIRVTRRLKAPLYSLKEIDDFNIIFFPPLLPQQTNVLDNWIENCEKKARWSERRTYCE